MPQTPTDPETSLREYRMHIHKRLHSNSKKPLPREERMKRARERREAGIETAKPKPDGLVAAEKATYFGTGSNMPRCDATTRNPPHRTCNMPCVSGYDKCYHHLPKGVWRAIRRARQVAPQVIACNAVKQLIREERFPIDTWRQPLWAACCPVLRLTPALTSGWMEGQLTLQERMALQPRIIPRDEAGRETVPTRTKRLWFRKNLTRMAEAWLSYLNGTPGPWLDINREARDRDYI